MHVRHLKPALIACGIAAATMPGIGTAATATGTMSISATVLASCTVIGGLVGFGVYDPVSATPNDATGTMTVTCSTGIPYTIAMDKGGNGSAVTDRQMGLLTNRLPYSLYRDAGHTLNWGETIGTDTLAGTGTGLPQTVTVYGRIGTGTSAAPGVYTDTVNITVNY